MEKVKQLPISKNALIFRLRTIQMRIKECEGEIPPKFWCDDCKRGWNKILNLREKIKNTELEGRAPPGIYTGLGNYLGDGSFSTPTPTFKYVCSICGRVWMNGVRSGIYRDLNKNVDRCSTCNGRVDEI